MLRALLATLGALSLAATLTVAAPAAAQPPAEPAIHPDMPQVFVGTLQPGQLAQLRALGLDHEDIATATTASGDLAVEAVLSARQAHRLATQGVKLTQKIIDGKTSAQIASEQARAGWSVYRSYSEPGGIRDELAAATAEHPGISKLVTIGESVHGQPIQALKVTRHARWLPDGLRPAVIYVGAQHAREWITPEMVRRLMHDVLAGYGSDPELTKLVRTTELWFLPVANPDGYDFTFTEGGRMWRKNLRDNNGDGTITGGDGVDPNRNFPYKWGYDNEGSSPDPANETYRGTGPGSEPETRALDALVDRVGFEFMINYHSAAELLLYGNGWQVSTPTPDDLIWEALLGDDADPAVPGYDPDLSAELYTTNGETTNHMSDVHGALAFTPEMSTCQTAAASDPDDEWEPAACPSVFHFPDDAGLIEAEYAKNVPLALAVAKSARHPDQPESVVGKSTADLIVDAFPVSYGSDQQVAAIARRSLHAVRMHYSINGGRARSTWVRDWQGGERYGAEGTRYFQEVRGTVRGAAPGDSVEVWFSGISLPGRHGWFHWAESDHFSYTVHDDIGGDVLVLAVEDVTGIVPVQEGDSAKYAADIAAAVEAAGYSSDSYDFDVMGRVAPHHLGVLSHYDAVVWETGDDIILREPGQVPGTTMKAALDTDTAVRDYLNEGGKLLLTGQYAQFAQAADGAYFYNPYAPPECTTAGAYPCLAVFNDLLQYWLGAYTYVSGGGSAPDGSLYPLQGSAGAFAGFAGELNVPGSAENQAHTASFLTTPSFLPPDEFPQFGGAAPVDWARPGGAPFDPHTGDWYAYSDRSDTSFKRLTKTVDLTGAAAGELRFFTSYDIEPDWDYLFVEARIPGSDAWTTLPDGNGNTATSTGLSCPAGWVDDIHPFLAHYQGADCAPSGTSGDWHAATGPSGGWQEWSVDLSGYAGGQVEVSITYASDWATQGLGVFLDDIRAYGDGALISETSFETDLGGWTVTGPPPGSPPASNDWKRTQSAFAEGAGVTTEDTVFLGFGLEGLAPAARDDLVARVMQHLLN